MTYRLRDLQAFLGNEFYDRIINLEKLEVSMKWMSTLKFALLGTCNWNKWACLCVCGGGNFLNQDLALT